MCEIPRWTPPCGGMVDAHSEQYYASLEQLFARLRAAQAQLSMPIKQYRCCGVLWWLPSDVQPQCALCATSTPEEVAPDDCLGYGMLQCKDCFYTWATNYSDMSRTQFNNRLTKMECRRNCPQKSVGRRVNLLFVGPSIMKNAFLEYHWLRRQIWRITGMHGMSEQERSDATIDDDETGCILKCPRKECGRTDTYTNSSPSRCRHCKKRVFKKKK